MQKKCKQCNKIYTKQSTHSKAYWTQRKYCSYSCKYKAMKEVMRDSVEKKCPICNESFFSSKSRLKRGRGKYCSIKCAAIRKTGVARPDMAGNVFGFRKGHTPWNKDSHIQTNTGRTHFKKGLIPYNKGIVGVYKASDKTKLKQSLAQRGAKGSNWQGGKSFESYPQEFNKFLKEVIRNRDNRQCRECKWLEKDLTRKLDIHHIDFDKNNNNFNNLISLCQSCHGKTLHDKEDWINYYKTKRTSFI